MSEIWNSPEYRKNVEEFLRLHPYCEWHGEPTKATVVHHPKKKNGYSKKEYISLEGGIGLCKPCHFAVGKHLHLCPICKQHYFFKKRNRELMCWECFKKTEFGQVVANYYNGGRNVKQ
jgi:hypothetical protein